MSAEDPIDALLRQARVLVVCGSGGVGKTTVSAALALRAAELGRRVAACTIDPARRLADSLGIDLEGEELEEVQGVGAGGGRLVARMLDSKRTFDRLIRRRAPNPEVAERILANRLYGRISSQVAGTQEYMAMETLYELDEDPEHELVVLDTPPTRHAVDFLTAPERMARVLDHQTLQWILEPPKGGLFSLVRRGVQSIARKLDEVFGMAILQDLIEFFRLFDGMYEGFRERSAAVEARLRSPDCAFVIVTSPEDNPLSEARFLMDELERQGLGLRLVILNRAQVSLLPDPGMAARLEPGEDLRGRRHAALAMLERLAAAEQARVRSALAGAEGAPPLAWIPRFSEDVCDLSGLQRVASRMMPSADGQAGGPAPHDRS